MISMRTGTVAFSLVLSIGMTAAISAQRGRGGAPPPVARSGTLERVTVRDHAVAVYLPPSYAADAMRRFPSVYLLADNPVDGLKVPAAADRLASAQGFSEPIVVMPDLSAVTGDAEKFVADDLVAYVDRTYRTIAARISRGVGGYAAGGDAALRVGMTRPEVFSSLYVMNPSQPELQLDAYAVNLQRLYDLAIDNARLHDVLLRLKVPHYYEEFSGDAAGRVATRMLPFFSKNLAAPANPTSPAVQ